MINKPGDTIVEEGRTPAERGRLHGRQAPLKRDAAPQFLKAPR